MNITIRQDPTQIHERIEFVDILRGFALIGVLFMNMNAYSGHEFTLTQIPGGINKIVVFLMQFFLQAKFYSLFSFLFGWGMATQFARAVTRGSKFIPYYLRRNLLLLMIGFIHAILIWNGDILVAYATFSFLLLLFRNRSPKSLLIFAAACLILSIVLVLPGETMDGFRAWYHQLTSFLRQDTQPFQLYAEGTYWDILKYRANPFFSMFANALYWFGNIFSMFLLGLYVGKRGIFKNIPEHLPLIRKVLWIGLAVGLVFNGIFLKTNLDPSWVPDAYFRLATSGARTIGAPALMLFYVSAIILLLRKESWRSRLSQLAPVGKMALSNYLAQSVICTLIFYNYGLGLYGDISPTVGLILSIFIYIGQMRFSAFWLERFQFGPVEWAWRSLAYRRRQPLRRGETYADLQPSPIGKITTGVKKIPQKYALIAVWAVLIGWAVGLVLWNNQLRSQGFYDPVTIIVRVTPTPDGITVEGPGPETGETTISTPVVEPVSYNPGLIAASGDMVSLAAALDVNAAFGHIEALADPVYEGRYTGTAGGFAAGEYIAEKFAEYGLQPAGDEGSFFQTFPITINQLSDIPTLSIDTDAGVQHEAVLFQDFAPITSRYLGDGQIQGPIFWADGCEPDTLQENDLVGKVVFCQGVTTTNEILNTGRLVLEYGANGLLLLTDPDTRPPDFGSRYYLPWVPETIPAFRVYPGIVDELLSGTGYHLEDLLDGLPPTQLETSASLQQQTLGEAACPPTGCLARNVLGVIPGRDPAFTHEVILIGGHYDHMGASPDGTIWYGANDNASGIAVMLEIARSWQEQGYVPRRTVVFAAWDAEEIGLLGSSHYVNNPRYPLDDTLGMIQLDMVGAGTEILSISGEEDLQAQILSTADLLGVAAEGSEMGRSDHIPFWEAGVPASLLIWWDDSTAYHLHRPNDTPEVIELEKLESVAQIANLSLLNLAESEPAILTMLDQRELAAEIGDQEDFLSTSQTRQIGNDRIWFDDLQSLIPIEVSIEAIDLQILGDAAFAQVKIQVEHADPEDEESENESIVKTASLDVGFEREDEGWLWAGPYLTAVPEEEDIPAFQVLAPPQEEELPGLGVSTFEMYAAIAGKLGLATETDATLYLLPDSEALRTNIAMSLPRDLNSWVAPGEIYLVYEPDLASSSLYRTAVAQLVLANAGIPQSAAPWLWSGLPLVLEAESDPRAVQSELLPDLSAALEIYPSSFSATFATGEVSSSPVELTTNQTEPYSPATSWAATDATLNDFGWSGLGGVISRFGDSCQTSGCLAEDDLENAYLAAFQKSRAGFDAYWKNQWKSSLEEVQRDLDSILNSRIEAALAGDVEAFLRTVDPSIPNLRQAEAHWVSHLIENSPAELSLYAQPLTVFKDGRILTSIEMDVLRSGLTTDISYPVVVKRTRTDPRWMGTPFKVLEGENVAVHYPQGAESLAWSLLEEADTELKEIAAALEISSPGKLILELFDDPDSFRASIFFYFPLNERTTAWTAEGENIKLFFSPEAFIPDAEGTYQSNLASQIARWLLYQSGVDSEWLLKGVSSLVSRPFDGGRTVQEAGAAYPEVFTKLEEGTLPRLPFMSQDYLLSQTEYPIMQTVAFDSVRYLVENQGWDQLMEILNSYRETGDLDDTMTAVLGISMTDFEREWRESLVSGHTNPDWAVIVDRFSVDNALAHINQLTSPQMRGRQAGTLGDQAAREYIAERFAAYGLAPIGGQEDGSYFQEFEITTRIMSSAPKLEITGFESPDFIFREDFTPVRGTALEMNQASGELVWVADYAALEFGDVLTGSIVVRPNTAEIDLEIEQALSYGAMGIILAGDDRDEGVFAKQPEIIAYSPDSPIPIFELTRTGTKKMLEATGDPEISLSKLPAISYLEINGDMEFRLPDPEIKPTANVLGYLPGSDPYLKDEIIIIGAHYDHVGNDPSFGLQYTGSNDNASGISGLLEIARIWQQSGYQPKRSVLFAAWGAQELGQVGSGYYVENPIYPLENTVGMIQMDGIAGGDGFYPGIQGEWETDGQLLFRVSTDDKLVFTPQTSPSDHFSFRDQSIPTLLVSWRLANEDNFPDEYSNRVSPEKLEVCGKLATLILMGAAR